MAHTDTSTTRAREHRERQTAKGMKWRGLWVYPDVWEKVRACADKLNRKHEKERDDEQR